MDLKNAIQRIRRRLRNDREAGQRSIFVLLDRESLKRLHRLKLKTKKKDESELMILALIALEQKVDKILKRAHSRNSGRHVPGDACSEKPMRPSSGQP